MLYLKKFTRWVSRNMTRTVNIINTNFVLYPNFLYLVTIFASGIICAENFAPSVVSKGQSIALYVRRIQQAFLAALLIC